MRKPLSIDFVVPDLFDSIGGIARIARSMALAIGNWADARQVAFEVSALVDASGQRDERYLPARFPLHVYGERRFALSRDLVNRAWSEPGRRIFVFAHPNLGSLVAAFPPGTRSAVVAHGIDVWTPMRLERRLALRRATRFWPVSQSTARHLSDTQGLDAQRTRVVLNALDPFWPLPSLAARPARDFLLTVARLHPNHRYKGIDLTIEALAMLPAERRPMIVVAGDGPDRPRLEALASSLGVVVQWAGQVDDAQLKDLFARASAFVMPSTGEGFGLVYLEAMAFGLPCVAARAGGAPEVVIDGDTGVVVAPGDKVALASAIETVTGDRGAEMGRLGRARVERYFLFKHYELRLHDVLDELADAG